jgi:hypothetical protein
MFPGVTTDVNDVGPGVLLTVFTVYLTVILVPLLAVTVPIVGSFGT